MPSDTVRDQVRRFLASTGTSVVFGNPGSTELPFFANWPQETRWVMALHEASAVAMADGYAQATDRPSFVTLHSAAGLGNAMCGVYSAARNCSPVVIMAGQQIRSMHPTEPYLYAEQSTNFPRPYVKWAIEPARAQDVPLAITRAHHMAAQRPYGPTFVSVPMDDWETAPTPAPDRVLSDRFTAATDELAEVAAKLTTARRPALVVGPEVERDGATAQAVDLADRTGAAVWVSPHINRSGFPEEHPAFQGQLRPSRSLIRQELEGCDLIVVLGAPVFVYHVESPGPAVPDGAELIQLSEDPAVLSRADAGRGIRTCVGDALTMLLDLLPPQHRPLHTAPAIRPQAEATTPMSGEYALHVLAQTLPPDTILVEEAPTLREVRHNHLPLRRPGSYYNAASGGLGWALPASVGIALAEPSRPVVCLIGDGAAQYSIQALWTAAQLGIRLIVIVLNNGAYGAMKGLSITLGADNPPSYDLPDINLTDLAHGYGCPGIHAATPDALAAATATALQAQQTTVIDVTLDPHITALYS